MRKLSLLLASLAVGVASFASGLILPQSEFSVNSYPGPMELPEPPQLPMMYSGVEFETMGGGGRGGYGGYGYGGGKGGSAALILPVQSAPLITPVTTKTQVNAAILPIGGYGGGFGGKGGYGGGFSGYGGGKGGFGGYGGGKGGFGGYGGGHGGPPPPPGAFGGKKGGGGGGEVVVLPAVQSVPAQLVTQDFSNKGGVGGIVVPIGGYGGGKGGFGGYGGFGGKGGFGGYGGGHGGH